MNRCWNSGADVNKNRATQGPPQMTPNRRRFAALATAFALPAFLLTIPFATGDAAASKHRLRADKVVVIKHRRILQLLWKGRVVRTYRVALGGNPKGHKVEEGDSRTPEGTYTIDHHFPKSSFHKALHISYPNDEDKKRAKEKGVDPGGQIEIHGLGFTMAWAGPRHAKWDWTAGCIAVTNKEIDEIYRAVPDGTPIEIMP
jgi:murein L,D-transpeptidase YafK